MNVYSTSALLGFKFLDECKEITAMYYSDLSEKSNVLSFTRAFSSVMQLCVVFYWSIQLNQVFLSRLRAISQGFLVRSMWVYWSSRKCIHVGNVRAYMCTCALACTRY